MRSCGLLAIVILTTTAGRAWASDSSGQPTQMDGSSDRLEQYEPDERALIGRLQSADIATRLAVASDKGTPTRVVFYLAHNDPSPEVRKRANDTLRLGVRSLGNQHR